MRHNARSYQHFFGGNACQHWVCGVLYIQLIAQKKQTSYVETLVPQGFTEVDR